MAHILVYLQRSPGGLHPASALALCIARDIASNRGASITALCPGDAGTLDGGIVRSAGRFGADVMVFFGPDGMRDIIDRLRPVHLLTPWTPEGLAAVEPTELGPAVPRWIEQARPPGAGADTVTGIVAGALPWHAFDAVLDPEYLGEVDAVPLAGWVNDASADLEDDASAPGFAMVPEGPLSYVAVGRLGAEAQQTLDRLGAAAVQPEAVAGVVDGPLLWFGDGGEQRVEALKACAPGTRSLLFPGPDAVFDPSWQHADLVIPGAWEKAVSRLHEPLWRAALA
ncbi:MAG: hypothetical protein AAF721_24755 [Myxococcota bacterium]